MKRITATALLAIASFVMAGSAFAADRAVQATIPFDFTVGDQLLAAGNYTITTESPGVIAIRDGELQVNVVTLLAHDDAKGKGSLVFNRYGDQYFLSEVLCPSAGMNAKIPQWKVEQRTRNREASLRSSGQTLVAIK